MRSFSLPQMLSIALGLLVLIGCRDGAPTAAVTRIPPSATHTQVPTRTPTHIPMPTPTLTPVLSPCPGERLAFVMSRDGPASIYFACPSSGIVDNMGVIDLSQYERPGDLNLSRKGTAVLFTESDIYGVSEIILMDLVSSVSKTILPRSAGKMIAYARWTSDEQYVGYVSLFDGDPEQNRSSVIEFLNISKQTVSRLELKGDVSLQEFQWSPDGQQILYLNTSGIDLDSPEYGRFLADVSCSDETGKCEVSNSHLLTVDAGAEAFFSFDGSSLIGVGDGENTPQSIVIITDLSTNSTHQIAMRSIDPNLEHISGPVFSPSETLVAFTADSVDTGVQNVYILDLEQMTLMNLTGNTSRDADYGGVTW
jgi:Tol biopolymer transport system component